MEKELRKQLWLSRALRCAAEQQKFHCLACALLSIGDEKNYKRYFDRAERFGRGVPKCLRKAVENGLEMKNEEEDRDRV